MASCMGQCTSLLPRFAPHCVRNCSQIRSFSSGLFSSICSPQLLPFTCSCWRNDSRMATKQHSSTQSATGTMQRFSKNVVSGVVPQLWDVFLPTCHVYVAAYDVQAMPVCISAGPQGVVEASSKAAGPATGFLAVMLLRWRLMTTKN